MNYLYGSIAILLALLGIEQYGEHRVQVKWNLETARLEALADQARQQSMAINKVIDAQHQKDIENAKSEAGKSAVRDYLKSHSLLHTEGNCGQAQSPAKPDEPASEPGTDASIEEFAGRCAQDALTVLNWQEWAKREGLEISE
jgi:hypothetical protein